jgi:hypothetical protein
MVSLTMRTHRTNVFEPRSVPHLPRVFPIPTDSPSAKVVNEQSDSNNSSCITFGRFPDPLGRYMPLKQKGTYNSYEMVWPPVFDVDGKHVRPGKYEDSIPDETLVKVSGNLRM